MSIQTEITHNPETYPQIEIQFMVFVMRLKKRMAAKAAETVSRSKDSACRKL
jgi:hypothetical protein